MTMLYAPKTLGYNRSGVIVRTVQNGGAARGVLVPPLRSSGTGRPNPERTPNWLASKIELSRRAARPQPCPKCGADTLVGPDHDTCAATARVDPTSVDQLHEVHAHLTGRLSYDLVRGHLHIRWPEHIHNPHRPHPVLVTHVCIPEVLF